MARVQYLWFMKSTLISRPAKARRARAPPGRARLLTLAMEKLLGLVHASALGFSWEKDGLGSRVFEDNLVTEFSSVQVVRRKPGLDESSMDLVILLLF